MIDAFRPHSTALKSVTDAPMINLKREKGLNVAPHRGMWAPSSDPVIRVARPGAYPSDNL